MSVQIKYTVDKSTVPGPEYEVSFKVIDNVDISPNIFVFTTSNDSFSHVATTRDLNDFPASKKEAEDDGLDFYRQSNVTTSFTTPSKATEFDTITRNRITILVTAWDTVSSNLVGSEVVTASSR